MKQQTLSDLETELIRRKTIDADLLRRFYTVIRHEIGEAAAQAFARTVLNARNLTFAVFLQELEALATNQWAFKARRVNAPSNPEVAGQSDDLKAEFFSTAFHQKGIPEDELRTLQLTTA